MGSFNENLFEEKLLHLKDTQDSIASLSSWCLSNKEHHEKIVSTWLSVLKKVKVEHRLILFYLANDIIQYSKRKSLPFKESFAPALQKATKMVREDNVRNKIMRLFKIWSERGIYDEEFLVDLSNVLNRIHKNASSIDVQEFQSSVVFSKIRKCRELEEDTDHKLNVLNKNHISFTDVDRFRKTLKDREHGKELLIEFDSGIGTVKAYIKALESEIKERVGLVDLLEIAEEYYEREFQEAKVVVNAYKCFATRVRGVKRKLEEQIDSMPSPLPSPDENAPSPSPEPKDDPSDYKFVEFRPNSYFPSDEIKKGTDDISPYSPPSDLDAEPIDSSYSEDSKVEKLQNGLGNDSFDTRAVPYRLSNSFSNDNFHQDLSLSGMTTPNNNSIPSQFQVSSTDAIKAFKVQQLSLSALLQTLMPSEGSSVKKNDTASSRTERLTEKPDDSWESPESPPPYEKANYPTVADEQLLNQDTDLRFVDRDDRNIIDLTDDVSTTWPNDDIDYRNHGKTYKVTSPGSQNQDNVENIDMEMSDEDDKPSRNKDSGVKDLVSSSLREGDSLSSSFQSSKHINVKFNDIGKEETIINPNIEERVAKPLTLPKNMTLLPDCNNTINATYCNSMSYNNNPVIYGINTSSNGNTPPFKNCFPNFISAVSGKGDGANIADFNTDKLSKLPPPLPPILPPPPPPPPPPHPSHLWSPSFSSPPPPPHFGSSQTYVQQSMFFPRPPPPVQSPQMPVASRPFRGNFRPFQRGPIRFQRW